MDEKVRKRLLIGLGALIIGLLIGLILIVKNENKERKILTIKESDKNNVTLYDELSDRNIYLHGIERIVLKYKGEYKELREWFNEDQDFLDKFIKLLGEPLDLYKDGGSRLYKKDGVIIIVCNTLDNNYNIHIGVNLVYEGLVCNMS